MSEGTKEITEAADLVVDVVKAIDAAKKTDGKLDGADVIPALMAVWPAVMPAVDNADKILAEIKDMDGTEFKNLCGHVVTRLALSDAHAILVVQKVVECLTNAVATIKSGKELRDAILNKPTA